MIRFFRRFNEPGRDAEALRRDHLGLLKAQAETVFAEARARSEIERLTGEAIGRRVRWLGMELIEPARPDLSGYVKTGRCHTRHLLAVDGQAVAPAEPRVAARIKDCRIEVFAKTGAAATASVAERRLRALVPEVTVPCPIGRFDARQSPVALWECLRLVRRPLKELSFDDQARLVRTIAAINACPVADLALPTAQGPQPPYPALAALARRDRAWKEGMERLQSLSAKATAPEAQAPMLLAHNDVHAANVAVADGEIVLFDWERAGLAPAGVDLRFLARRPRREQLLDVYVARMAELGRPLDRAVVRRTLEEREGLRLVEAGINRRALGVFQSGLGLLERRAGR